MKRLFIAMFSIFLLFSCASAGEKVVKPKTHKMWARGNRYLIDIPVGVRHIRLFERKRTRMVRMR